MVIAPEVLIDACRLLAASAELSSFSVETWPAPVPKVMAVAVPPPVAAMSSVRPVREPRVAVAPVPRPSAASAPELFDVIDRSAAVPVVDHQLAAGDREAVVLPVRASILASNVLTCVGDVDLVVAGRARGLEGEGLAVDGDGIARRKRGGERAGRAGQRRGAADGGGGGGVVLFRSTGEGRTRGAEQVVAVAPETAEDVTDDSVE